MKARIKATGEEITIIGISKDWGTAQYYGSDGIYRQRRFGDKEIEILDTVESPIDWEQRRYEIAKDVLAAQISDVESAENNSEQILAKWAVKYADALIEELKGGRKWNE